ncbi:MAG: acetolactate synthase large subunit [bacterium]|nr:acetolactate synthase large subunit [Candidatus Aquidulcis frankliniae]
MLRDARVTARGGTRPRIGADALCEAILRQGSDTIWGYPGGVILPLYDVLVDHPELRHILVRHEQAASHAADGYARASGKVGVCLGTSGPGATNLVTGIGTAMLDSVPVVVITGNVPNALIGKDAFQEIDITGITLPMTKHNYLVRTADEIPYVIAEAFHLAREAIAGAKRPVILAGHGVLIAGAERELLELARAAQIPITWTLLGIGVVDETDPLAYGYMGMHGWKHVNRAIQSADLLIGIGMRFDDRVTGNVRTYAPKAKIAHIDIDPAEIGKNVVADLPIVGDAKHVLDALLPLVTKVDPATRADYFAELATWRTESEGSSWHGSGGFRDGVLSADFVVERIAAGSDFDANLTADVGQNQMWVARYGGFRRANSHLSSGGLGTMGFALPGAMGAAVAVPNKVSWAIAGDGGFQMTLQELATIVQERIPVKIALMDNKKLGMIRQWQEIVYAGNYHSEQLAGPDYLKLCDAYGLPSWKVSKPEEVDAAVAAALAADGPALIWFEIAERQNVYPMMPAGKGLSDLIDKWGDDGEDVTEGASGPRVDPTDPQSGGVK